MIFLHEQKILHLDLRCVNIMISKDYNIKISDFGISKWKEGDIDIPNEYKAIHYIGKDIYDDNSNSEQVVYDAKFDIK